jgi:hypothetical protein
MFNNSSDPACGKGGNITILFSEPTPCRCLTSASFKTFKNFSFHSTLCEKQGPVQVKKMMQKLSDSSLK